MSECCLFYSLWVLRVRGQAGAPSLSIDIIHKKKELVATCNIVLLPLGIWLYADSHITHWWRVRPPRQQSHSATLKSKVIQPNRPDSNSNLGSAKKHGPKTVQLQKPGRWKLKSPMTLFEIGGQFIPLLFSVISTTINGALKLASRAAALPYKNAPFATISSIRSLSFIKSRLCLPPNSSPILFSKEDDFCPETHKPFWVYFSESFSL